MGVSHLGGYTSLSSEQFTSTKTDTAILCKLSRVVNIILVHLHGIAVYYSITKLYVADKQLVLNGACHIWGVHQMATFVSRSLCI